MNEYTAAQLIAAGEAFLQTATGRAKFTGPVTVNKRGTRFNVIMSVPVLETALGTIEGKGSIISLHPDLVGETFNV